MVSRRFMITAFALMPFPAFALSLEAVKEEAWPVAQARGVSERTFEAAFSGLTYNPKMLELATRQPEVKDTIGDYVDKRVSKKRIENGRAAWSEWSSTLKEIGNQYGVSPSIVCAIWGMETAYGANFGDFNVIQSLASLVASGKRRDFFFKELIEALVILQNGDITPQEMKGSWAGAMGQTQFMPSSFKTFAVDYDGDGKRNIWSSKLDAFASTANYLKKNGWVAGIPWGKENINGQSSLQGRYFAPMGENAPTFTLTQNFNVIKRYNNSDAYALAVGHLADRIVGGDAFSRSWPSGNDGLTHAERIELQQHLLKHKYDIGEPDGILGDKSRNAILDVQNRLGLPITGVPSKELLIQLRKYA